MEEKLTGSSFFHWYQTTSELIRYILHSCRSVAISFVCLSINCPSSACCTNLHAGSIKDHDKNSYDPTFFSQQEHRLLFANLILINLSGGQIKTAKSGWVRNWSANNESLRIHQSLLFCPSNHEKALNSCKDIWKNLTFCIASQISSWLSFVLLALSVHQYSTTEKFCL